MNDVKLSILPPWSIYINKLLALFDGDPQIAFNVDWSGTNPSVVLATNNPDKAAALTRLLPTEKTFGNVTMSITIDCSTISNLAFPTTKELFETAFSKNPAFAYAVSTEGYMYVPFTYIVFAHSVVQFFADNLNDPHGVKTTLYQDIAAEVFEDMGFNNGVAYCTALEGEVNTNETKLNASVSGGWDVDIMMGKMPQKIATAFGKLADMVGANYTPIAYLGSQTVNGINHAVLAEQTVLTGKDTKNIVLIIFNEKPGDMNDPTVVNIERIIESTDGFGGTAIDVKSDIPDEAIDVFNAALEVHIGARFEPKALLATHVTGRGVEYAFLTEMTPITIDAEKTVYIIVVDSLTKSVSCTDILSDPKLGYAFNW